MNRRFFWSEFASITWRPGIIGSINVPSRNMRKSRNSPVNSISRRAVFPKSDMGHRNLDARLLLVKPLSGRISNVMA